MIDREAISATRRALAVLRAYTDIIAGIPDYDLEHPEECKGTPEARAFVLRLINLVADNGGPASVAEDIATLAAAMDAFLRGPVKSADMIGKGRARPLAADDSEMKALGELLRKQAQQ